MNIARVFKDTTTDDVKLSIENMIKECNEGFAIFAEDAVRLSVMEEYIDHLYNSRESLIDAKKKVEHALNRMVEVYNCGSKALVQRVTNYLNNKWSKTDPVKSIANKVAVKLSGINQRFVTSKVKASLETYAPVEKQEEGYLIALDCVNKTALSMIKKCFPEDFSNRFK